MVTLALLWVLALVVGLVVGLFPDVPPADSVLGDAGNVWSQLVGYMGGAASWFPFGHLAIALGLIFAVLMAAAGIRGVRIVASFLTLGGGA